MTSNDGHTSPTGLKMCLRCKNGEKGMRLDWSETSVIIGSTPNVRM